MAGLSKFTKNLSWVFFGNAIHAVFQFLLIVLAARILTVHDYGLINYATSLVSLFSAVCTLGFSGVITKKFAENEQKGGAYLWSTILTRIVISFPVLIILQVIGYYHSPADTEFHKIMACQSLSILFASGDLFIYWFRYKYKASIVAIVSLASFGIMAVWRIIALFLLKNTMVYVFGTVFETALLSIILCVIYLKMKQPRLYFSLDALKRMMAISYPFIFSAILSTVYGQTDKIMLESMVGTEAVAYYSVSLTLAGAISIIPTALIEGFRPEIFTQKEKNIEVYRKRLRQLYCSVFWICVAYCTLITLIARPLVMLLYGEKYMPAILSLSLIVWYTSFSYFGAINNIYMIAESKTKWVLITTLIGAALNVLLNALLIPLLDIRGAALASLVTQIFVNFILLAIIKPLRENFRIMLSGICFNNILKNNRGG